MAAMEQTTPEILTGFKNIKAEIDAKSVLELQQILELADLVKFAKLSPLPDENFNMLTNAYLFVKETTNEAITVISEPEKKEEVIDDLKDKKEENQL